MKHVGLFQRPAMHVITITIIADEGMGLGRAAMILSSAVGVTSGCSTVEPDHRDDDAELIMSVRSTS